MRIEPGGSLRGRLRVPGDKSISHRYALLGAMAEGSSIIGNYSPSADCAAMLRCLQLLGCDVTRFDDSVTVQSGGWARWSAPPQPLNADNSGTALRLLAGPLAGAGFGSTLTGDASLRQRPMARIVEPLSRMGAVIDCGDKCRPPLTITGRRLQGVDHAPPQASAQVKSCLLLAGLVADGVTTVSESRPTRDHTERALPEFGVVPELGPGRVQVEGPARLSAARLRVPGDLSAAAYFVVAALLVDGSRLLLPEVGCNPTRSALLELLEEAGLAVRRLETGGRQGEPRCDLSVEGAGREALRALPDSIPEDRIPNLIDELPLLAVLASQAPSGLRLRGASELRYKETDRIQAVVTNLKSVGVEVEEFEDGFDLPGGQTLRGGRVTTFGDHRIAMTFAVAGLLSKEGVEIDDPACAAVSHPNFFRDLESLRSAP